MRLVPKAIVLFCAVAVLAAATPAHALRVATWNLLAYAAGNGSITPRQADFRTVMAGLDPDILIVQEMNVGAARDSFLYGVLDLVQPGQWTASAWVNVGSSEGMAIFWKPAVVSVSSVGSFTDGGPRSVMQCLVQPVGYLTNPGWFRLYSFHLKAGQTDTATRRVECTNIRNTLNIDQSFAGPNFLIGGDSNIYSANEGSYIRLTESQGDNDGRCKDYLYMPGNWHENSGYLLYHTQCTCNTTDCLTTIPGVTFSGGGMDDRFDMLLSSYSARDWLGLDVIGYVPYGQDGAHYNQAINNGGYNYAVGYTIATALHNTSDHLPVVTVLRLPAKIAAASMLDFGTVITGATAEQPLAVSNIAPVPIGYTTSGSYPVALPGDTLRYTMSPPTDFSAPGGNLIQLAGATATNQTIGMSTATTGTKVGTLTLATNDPDTLSKSVLLSGKVLRHAAASLDSLAVLLADTLDFGDRPPESFADTTLPVFNQGYDALQARLAVSGGVITGGNGHFSIPGGFQAALVAGAAANYPVRFDTAGATLDSTYYATLTFTDADEALPGAQPQPDLVVTLRARAVRSNTDAPAGLPTALRFYPPRPNPSAGAVRFAFDLPKTASVRLEVFDLSGRRVASLVEGEVGAGRHEVGWDAGLAQGRLTAGLYYARFSTSGLARTMRLVLLP